MRRMACATAARRDPAQAPVVSSLGIIETNLAYDSHTTISKDDADVAVCVGHTRTSTARALERRLPSGGGVTTNIQYPVQATLDSATLPV